MAFDQFHRSTPDLDDAGSTDARGGGVPGKRPVTAGLHGRPQTNIVFRVESAEAATALAGALGPRDRNGVAAGADAAVDRAAGSSGSALPAELRERFESSLGADLSAVRIHTGGESAEAAGAVGARAYTTGNDIHFNAGQYDPQSAFGVHLLAHEVAHTQQQAGSSPTRQHKLEVSTPQDSAEHEADRAADAMVDGAPATLAGISAGLARTPDSKDASEGADVINGVRNAANGKDGSRSFKSDSTKLTLAGKSTSLSYGPSGLKGSLKLGGASMGLGKKLDYKQFIPLSAAGGFYFMVGGGVTVNADAAVSATGAAPTDDTITGTITGAGSVGVTATGRVTAGMFAGLPLANIHAGGYLELSANVSAAVAVSGQVTIKDNGAGAPTVTGTASLKVEPSASIVGTGGITVGYNAVVTDGKLYEHELGSVPIAKVSVPCTSTYDFATQTMTQNDIQGPVVEYLPFTLGAARPQMAGANKFFAGVTKRAKEQRERLEHKDENAKQNRLDHGIDDERQQSFIPDADTQPDCTHPDDLDVPTDPAPRPRPKTWVSVVD